MTRAVGALALAGLCLAPAWTSFRPEAEATLEGLARASLSQLDGTLPTRGLKADVQVVRDTWGVPHIYARSTDDLFFAQGYVMAQDRLWQMEMARRTAEGKLAEVLGPEALARDRQARLTKYRGPTNDTELGSYHPEGRRIMTAFVNGVNAFIAANQDRLPVEFVLTGIRPEPWTIESLVQRSSSMADAAAELTLARSVAQLGAAEANRRRNPDPWDPLDVPAGLDVSIISDDVLAATRVGGTLPRPEILAQYRALGARLSNAERAPSRRATRAITPRFTRVFAGEAGLLGASSRFSDTLPAGSGPGNAPDVSVRDPGSNNWVVSGALSATGKPVVANDPHRDVQVPSLRYIVHLNAPGWNVVGSGEPPFLGVAIGHNDRIAWGLTIVGTDQQDVFVEELNPANLDEAKWNGRWEPLRTVREQIKVKGQPPVDFEMKFSRHGPIFFTDAPRRRAYALRSALLEPGAAPYLAGLRLAQVRDCRGFLDAAMYWKSPSENLICGDADGNISWQASALTPIRKGWTGRLPVPGTGEYEWLGFRKQLPRELNPARGFIATANHNIQPKDYTPPLMFKTADTRFERITRLLQMIRPGQKYTLEDHQRMQHDALSLRAAADLPLFKGWTSPDSGVERARADLAAWDAVYGRDSGAAAIYESWRAAADDGGRGRGQAPAAPPLRDEIEARLRTAIGSLSRTQGMDRREWRWGRMHTRTFPHPFVAAFDLPTIERAGGAGTVAADGATYREVMDVADWDRSLVANVPGQSGQPMSPYYSNLLKDWAKKKYFPLAYSKGAVDRAAAHRLTLVPSK